jgi:hypothetical protein
MVKGLQEVSLHLIEKINQNRVSTGNKKRARKLLSSTTTRLMKIGPNGKLIPVTVADAPRNITAGAGKLHAHVRAGKIKTQKSKLK